MHILYHIFLIVVGAKWRRLIHVIADRLRTVTS